MPGGFVWVCASVVSLRFVPDRAVPYRVVPPHRAVPLCRRGRATPCRGCPQVESGGRATVRCMFYNVGAAPCHTVWCRPVASSRDSCRDVAHRCM